MVEIVQQRFAMLKPVERNITGEFELIEMEVGNARVAYYLERVMGRTQEPGNLTGQLHHVVHDVRQGDEFREPRACLKLVTQSGAETGWVVSVVSQQLK